MVDVNYALIDVMENNLVPELPLLIIGVVKAFQKKFRVISHELVVVVVDYQRV